ncbi:hypothetical protein D3C80_1146190 [compost metagenome]
MIGQRAFVGHRQLVQIVHQLGERAHFRLQRRHRFRRKLTYAVLNRFQFAAQYRQRGTQFVRNIGHKVAAHLLVFLQGAGELVKILGQFADLVLAARIHAR